MRSGNSKYETERANCLFAQFKTNFSLELIYATYLYLFVKSSWHDIYL